MGEGHGGGGFGRVDGAYLVLGQPLPDGELQAGVWQLYREGILAALDHAESAHAPTMALN